MCHALMHMTVNVSVNQVAQILLVPILRISLTMKGFNVIPAD
jgi:hypothetical protein